MRVGASGATRLRYMISIASSHMGVSQVLHAYTCDHGPVGGGCRRPSVYMII